MTKHMNQLALRLKAPRYISRTFHYPRLGYSGSSGTQLTESQHSGNRKVKDSSEEVDGEARDVSDRITPEWFRTKLRAEG
jgi:hypothetical protein